MQRGKFCIISGFTGAGKSTLIQHLRLHRPDLLFLRSITTRAPRPEELTHPELCSYDFVTEEQFRELITTGQLLEHALVHNAHYYGTRKQPIFDAIAAGQLIYKEMDVAGYEIVEQLLPAKDFFGITLQYDPTEEEIRQRLTNGDRAMEEADVQRRMASIAKEQEVTRRYQYHVESVWHQMPAVITAVEGIIAQEMHEQ
ncbi:hypothetical protein H6771_01965 [Candidatus Peribacteria bacterium]|nr:hypothetical protein [Candidatus Peribacteria bacterium]